MNSKLFKKLIKHSKKGGFTLPNFSGKNSGGFTLLELIIFMAIFALIAISFVAVLISILRVQNRETSVAEVNRQSQFVISTIQRYIEESSLIDNYPSDFNISTSTLVLRMASSSDVNPYTCIPNPPNYPNYPNCSIQTPVKYSYPARTIIYLENNKIFLKEFQNGSPQPLTSDRVIVDRLDFKIHRNFGSKDSVDITLALHYNSPNIQKQFAQTIQTAIARANAATFDSSVIPSSTSPLNLGALGTPWNSINGIINFSNTGLNVGIGTSPDATYQLSVNAPLINLGGLHVAGPGFSVIDGNLGIGVNPTNKLSVNGDASFTSDVSVGGASIIYPGLAINGVFQINVSDFSMGIPCGDANQAGIIKNFKSGNGTYLILCALDKNGTPQMLFLMATSTLSY